MTETIQFEKALAELEQIVSQLEKGDLLLDESLKQFEAGISLVRKCQDVLKHAEQKIECVIDEQS